MVSRGLLSGVTETTFAANTAITRADFLIALGKLSGVDVTCYKISSFVDVDNNSTSMPYIEWDYQKGIVNGTGNDRFSPDASISREQMAVMMQNYARVAGCIIPVSRKYEPFTDDNKISSWAKGVVKAIAQAGIVNGKGDGSFDPKGKATRAEGLRFCRGLWSM